MAQPTKVFVGSLPPGTKPEELRRIFENYGIVVECDVMNRCGFVHMKNAAMAESAIVGLNASEFKGQNIVVEHGRPKERKQGGGGGSGGRAGNQGGGGGSRGGRGILVGFPGKQINSNFNQATTLQLAGVIMDLLGDQQNQLDDISGGDNNNIRGVGGGDEDFGFRRGGGRGSNFKGGNRGGNQNMNGFGPMRNQGFKSNRPGPFPQGNNTSGPNNQGGRLNNQSNRGSGGGSAGNYNNNPRGGNFAPKAAGNNFGGSNNSWNNDQRGGIPPQGGHNFAEDNFSGGFSGNMGNSSGGNFGGQQDRRGFALPSNQFQQYSGGNKQMGGFDGNEGGSFSNDAIFQRRNNNPSNGPIIIDFRNAGGNFNPGGSQGGRAGAQGGFQKNRGNFQQGGDFKRGVPGGNNTYSADNYQQNFPALGGGGGQRGFGNNRNQGGRGGGGMNRNAPRQNMPNRRY